MKKLATHFVKEFEASGLSPQEFWWNSNGNYGFTTSESDQEKFKALIASHDPDKNPFEYIKKRRAEYPPIGDQLDVILKFIDANEEVLSVPQELRDVIDKHKIVKEKYPKPEAL